MQSFKLFDITTLCSFNRFIFISLALLGLSVSSVNAAEEAQILEFEQQQQQAQQAPSSAHQSNNKDEIISRFKNAIKYRRFRYKDFNEVVYDERLQITVDMVALMSESVYAADIAYYLGKHPDEAIAVSQMELPQAGAAIFTLEKILIQTNFKIE
jgi:hypothetical protein